MEVEGSPKVRDFVWCACWNIIPHGANIQSKGVPDYIICRRCGRDEHLMHLLFDYPWIIDFWKVSKVFPNIVRFLSFR